MVVFEPILGGTKKKREYMLNSIRDSSRSDIFMWKYLEA